MLHRMRSDNIVHTFNGILQSTRYSDIYIYIHKYTYHPMYVFVNVCSMCLCARLYMYICVCVCVHVHRVANSIHMRLPICHRSRTVPSNRAMVETFVEKQKIERKVVREGRTQSVPQFIHTYTQLTAHIQSQFLNCPDYILCIHMYRYMVYIYMEILCTSTYLFLFVCACLYLNNKYTHEPVVCTVYGFIHLR